MLAVTGITGHTGKFFLEELKTHHYAEPIRCLVHTAGKAACVTSSGLDTEIVEGTLDCEADIRRLLTGADTVVHIANIHYSPEILRIGRECGARRFILVHTTGMFSKFKSVSAEYREIEDQIAPMLEECGVYQITLMTDSVLSSGMGTGSISILSYANTISGMINTVITGNIMTYLYPKIAAEIHTENGKKKIFQYMNLFAALMFTIVVLFIAAGYDAVRILFERGAFTSESTRGVFLCVLLYVMGAPISIMRDVVYRFFYANGNTKGTFYNGLFASLMNIALSVALARVIGLYSIVLGTTLTAVFSFASILARMKKTYGFDGNFRPFAVDLLKTLAAAAAAAAICLLLKCCLRMLPSLLASLICAAAGTAVFILVLLITKSRVFQVELG